MAATSLADAIAQHIERQAPTKGKDSEPDQPTLSDEDLSALVEALSTLSPADLGRLVEALAPNAEDGNEPTWKVTKDPNAPRSLADALSRQFESLRGPKS